MSITFLSYTSLSVNCPSRVTDRLRRKLLSRGEQDGHGSEMATSASGALHCFAYLITLVKIRDTLLYF